VASAGSYYVHRALVHYYLGEHEEAGRYLAGVRRYLSGLTDNVLKRQWHVFLALNALKLYEKREGEKNKEALLAEITPFIEKIKTWAALGPLLKPYLAFLYAERERVLGDFKEARSLYLDAIAIAHEQKYTLLEGHLNECLGEFLLQAGQRTERVYFVEAARLYRKCRAERKELNLAAKYPDYFEEEKFLPLSAMDVEAASVRALPDLDFNYLIKSSLAISAEKDQDAMVRKIMTVALESSGAQHGCLVIGEDGNLLVRAETRATESATTPPVPDSHRALQKLEDSQDICKAIVRYVYRTGEHLILSSAAHEGPFKDNPEVQALQLRSVLRLPLTRQATTVGMLYLENQLSDAVFTAEKTQMTELLMLQASILLENARLTENLHRFTPSMMQKNEG
jgi:GAF domain-containing protein